MAFLVAVEPCDGGVKEWWRRGEQVVERFIEYYPFAIVPAAKEGSFMGELPHSEKLEGEGYNTLLTFESWRNFYNFKKLLKGRNDAIAYSSPAKNYLVNQTYRMFEGAKFDDCVRLAVDIETTGLDPCEDEIILLTYRSNRGHEGFLDGTEEEILRKFVRCVESIDPDVIEGHNILGFDFPFIHTRAGLVCKRLSLGRDGSAVRLGRERTVMIGPNERTCTPVYVHGRHVVDTYIAVQKFDIAAQKLSSYGLKEAARAYGIASEDRIELDRSKMREHWEVDRGTVIKYALQDVEENLKLGNIVLPVEFMQASIVPDSYSGSCLTGNGEKVNSILVAEYLRRGKAIPFKRDREDYIGGYVECRAHGVFGPIIKADVESLYPSLMLTRGIKPENDVENVFLPNLQKILTERLIAKRKIKETSGQEKDYWQGMSDALKILANSHYGYLGGPFHWNDYSAATQVTMGGRELVQKVADTIESLGGRVIECDTDGVMCVPPPEVQGYDQEETFVDSVGALALPPGIKLAHDGRYKTLVSVKAKNYVLEGYDGYLTMKGNSLRSRSSEQFGKDFLSTCIRMMIDNDRHKIAPLYADYLRRLVTGEFGIDDIKRRERITEATKVSPAKARLRRIAGGMKIGEYVYVYDRNDGTLAFAEDYDKDEDTLKYCQKLFNYISRLSTLFTEEEFKTWFVKPGKRWLKAYREALNG